MRIVYLITVGAFLLSITMAEGDMPMGTPQYHQRMPRPIILEPVKKYNPNNEENPLNWFFNMVSRVMDTPKKLPPPMIGPINLPGMAGQVYIKQAQDGLPWQSHHIVIRMMTRDPVTGLTVPMDNSVSSYNRLEGSSRRVVKSYGYQPPINSPGRPNNMIQQGFVPSSVAPAYSSWSAGQYRQRPQQYSAPYSKPLRPSSPNDFRYENYGKTTEQPFSKGHPEDYGFRRPYDNNYQHSQPNFGKANPDPSGPASSVASPSMYQPILQQTPSDNHAYSSGSYDDEQYKQSLQNPKRHENFYTAKPDSLKSTRIPYPEYPPLREDDLRSSVPRTIGNETRNIDKNSVNNFQGSARYRSVIRADRMAPVADQHRNNFVKSRTRTTSSHDSRGSNGSRDFREGSAAKFDAVDVGGIEVIAAPNLKIGWDHDTSGIGKNEGFAHSSSGNSRDSDSGLNQDEDSISMGNGKNLARGESAEHVNEQLETVVEQPIRASRRAQSRISSYSIIDRAHRSQVSQNITSESPDRSSEKSFEVDRIDNKNNSSFENNEKSDENFGKSGEVESSTRISNASAEVVQKVMNLTASNRWRLHEGRKPRLVKAIYRRKPRIGMIKSSRESLESNDSSLEKSSLESSSDN